VFGIPIIILYPRPTDYVAVRMRIVNFAVQPTYAHRSFNRKKIINRLIEQVVD